MVRPFRFGMLLGLAGLLLFVAPARGTEAPASASAAPAPLPAAPPAPAARSAASPDAVLDDGDFPGLADVAPRAARLSQSASEARQAADKAVDMAAIADELRGARDRIEAFGQRLKAATAASRIDMTWMVDARVGLEREKKRIDELVATISARLSGLETLRQEWRYNLAYWTKWRESAARTARAGPPPGTFDQARDAAEATLAYVGDAVSRVMPYQEQAAKALQEIVGLDDIVAAQMRTTTGETLSRVDPSVLEGRFWRELAGGVAAWRSSPGLTGVSGDDFLGTDLGPEMAQRAALFMVLAVVLYGLGKRYRDAARRRFLFRHPLALGYYLSASLSFILFPEPTGTARKLLIFLFAVSLGRLALDLPSPRKSRALALYVIAGLVVTDVMLFLVLPWPLTRLFLLVASLAGALYLLGDEKDQARTPSGFWAMTVRRVVLLALLVSFLAQFFGYVFVANEILVALCGVSLTVLSARVLLLVGEEAVDLVLGLPSIAARESVVHFGPGISSRLKQVLKVVVICLSGAILFRFMGFITSNDNLMESFFKYQFSLGPLHISPGLMLLAALVLYISIFVSWFCRAILDGEVFPRKQIDPGVRDSITKLLHYFLIFIGFIAAASVLGFEMKSLAVMGGALGVGLGFGLQAIFNNFISGLILLFERPITVGDRVTVDGDKGIVKNIGLRSTIVETFDRAELIIPNSQFISQKVTNWTLSNAIARLKITVGVAYGSDIGATLALMREVAASHPQVLSDPAPTAYMVNFGESSLDFELQAWLPNIENLAECKSELCQELDRRFRAAGIEIPFPRRDVRVRSE